MQRTKAELTAMKMTSIYYIRFILCIFPIATLAVSVVYIIFTSPKIWINAVGSNLLVANLFNMIFSLVSFVLILLCTLGVKPDVFIISQAFFVFTILSFILSFITLSLSSQRAFSQNCSDIADYCVRNPANSFCTNDGTSWGINNYVRKRTTYMYDWCAGITAPYVSIFVIYVILCSTVPSKKRKFVPSDQKPKNEIDPNDGIVNQFEPDKQDENNDNQALLNHDETSLHRTQETHPNNEERLQIQFSDSSYEEDDDEISLHIKAKPKQSGPSSPVRIQTTDPASKS